jgi:hypothetical protein
MDTRSPAGKTFLRPRKYSDRAMRRILLMLGCLAVLALPAAAAARAHTSAKSGFLVVRNGATDGGLRGPAVVTVALDGFVLGRVSQEGAVQIFHLASHANAGGTPQAAGIDVSRRAVSWHGVSGTEFSGSGFRFRAVGGVYRVVIHGSGVFVYAAGHGRVTLHGSTSYPTRDGTYSLDGQAPRSLPSGELTRGIGQ